MKRKAILIFNDGGPSNYLPGVKIDKANYLDFLKSPESGAWKDDEIKVYDNDCTKTLLLNYIKFHRLAEHPGFWLIIFSGHGYTEGDSGNTILELSPGHECSVQDIKDATEYSRRLLIADSCRTVYHHISESVKDKAKLYSTKSTDYLYINRCRELYMEKLEMVSRNTFNATYAAAYNQAANDDDAIGGYYSYELLRAARHVVAVRKSSYRLSDFISPIESIHESASVAVKNRTNNTQTPVSDGNSIDIIPFVVVPKL